MFEDLKKRFTKELVLAVLDLDKKMRMEVDMSDYTIEGILSMLKSSALVFQRT